MAIGADFSISAAGDIRYTGSTTNYTVIEFHRWLGDLMDDAAAAGNDLLDITNATASERSTDNIITLLAPYNIDDTAAQHLYDGSVIQAGGDTIYDGVLVFAAAGMRLEVIQNGALVTPNFWTTGLNADAANGISHRFMLKVRATAADIDGRRLIGQTREFGYTYSQFPINGTARGNNVMALTYATDLNNQTIAATVSGWTGITNTEGYRAIDVNNDSTNEYYFSEWVKSTYTINQFYERMKWLTRRGSTSTIYGLNGELFKGITHEVALTTPRTGTFSAVEAVSWGAGATAGTGQMFAIDSVGTGTKMWLQLLTGVAPSASVTITGVSTATATNSGTPTERTLSFPFCGASTGSAIIGSYGFGMGSTSLTASDKLFDLSNTQRVPPNYVTFTVSGLVNGEDRVLVGPKDTGSAIKYNQFTLNGTLSGATVTSVIVNIAIPTDTPATGTIRVLRNSGVYSRIAYTSYTGSTFTIGSTDFSTDNATTGNNCFISYIDLMASASTASFTGVYLADRDLYVRVRDGASTPIKTFESPGTLGSAGGSASVIRTSDA